MVIDTSAMLAILLAEPEAAAFLQVIKASQPRRISAPSFLEASMVLSHDSTRQRQRLFEEILVELKISIDPVGERIARGALAAFLKYGKGRGHAAALNFGGCFSYALAMALGEPLLFKGADFSQTDVQAAS